MKERIVIADKDVSAVCEDCIKEDYCNKKYAYEQARCCFTCGFIPANIEVEKYPTSWEELKELCKGRNKIRIANVEGTESIILNDNLICDKYGNVFADFSEHTYCFAQNRTIPQLWSFIKSLIGEE